MYSQEPESRRSKKVADQIKSELGWILQQKYTDPQHGMVTVTRVRLSRDLKYATVYFSVLGQNIDIKVSEKGLKNAIPFLRRELGQKVRMKFVPELRFFYDDSLEYSEHIAQLFKKIHDDKDNS
jgi:ribosome-binding factor A